MKFSNNTIGDTLLHIAPAKKDKILSSIVDEWIAQGEANILIHLLSRRFGKLPNHIKEKISNANSERIELWVDRFIDSSNLSDIFDDLDHKNK